MDSPHSAVSDVEFMVAHVQVALWVYHCGTRIKSGFARPNRGCAARIPHAAKDVQRSSSTAIRVYDTVAYCLSSSRRASFIKRVVRAIIADTEMSCSLTGAFYLAAALLARTRCSVSPSATLLVGIREHLSNTDLLTPIPASAASKRT